MPLRLEHLDGAIDHELAPDVAALAAAEGAPSRGGRHALLEHLDEHARAGHWEGDARVALIDTRVGTILSRIDEVGAEVEQDGHGVE